jgi:hypothetical protein
VFIPQFICVDEIPKHRSAQISTDELQDKLPAKEKRWTAATAAWRPQYQIMLTKGLPSGKENVQS